MDENPGRKQKRVEIQEEGERGKKMGKAGVEQQMRERERDGTHCLSTRPACRLPVSMVTGI